LGGWLGCLGRGWVRGKQKMLRPRFLVVFRSRGDMNLRSVFELSTTEFPLSERKRKRSLRGQLGRLWEGG